MSADRPVVAFDFDGTLTVRDSLLAFLRRRFGAHRFIMGLAGLTPDAIRYVFDHDRGRLKSALISAYLSGWLPARFCAEADLFAESIFSSLLRPDALACWTAWGERGAMRVIVTASPEWLVAPFARRLGADLLIATRLAIDSTGRLTGALNGTNCRGREKVSRLRAVFGPDLRLAAAYGDTTGDREMLAISEAPGYKIFRAKPA